MIFDKYKQYTQARVGLGNHGPALPTAAWLDFSYQHAAAVDATHEPWNFENLKNFPTQILSTQIQDREEYLLRPDKGRRLSDASRLLLNELPKNEKPSVLIVASNGLSSFAVTHHLENYLSEVLMDLTKEQIPLCAEKVFLVPNARVGLIDDMGEILRPTIGLMIIGERPGLSSADSLAMYLTYRPEHGRSDADRNCISNIRPPFGLSYTEARLKTMFLIRESIRRQLSGVHLKDESNLLTTVNPN